MDGGANGSIVPRTSDLLFFVLSSGLLKILLFLEYIFYNRLFIKKIIISVAQITTLLF
jgi:hypothetical protein